MGIMSLNPNEYVQCPYCVFRYLDDGSERVKDAIAGHINLKHKDKPKVKTGKDYVVEIPKMVPGKVTKQQIKKSIPKPNKSEIDKQQKKQSIRKRLDAKKKELEQMEKDLENSE